jgi:hypothetical protein
MRKFSQIYTKNTYNLCIIFPIFGFLSPNLSKSLLIATVAISAYLAKLKKTKNKNKIKTKQTGATFLLLPFFCTDAKNKNISVFSPKK